jgi:hypothetical protein
LRLRAGSAAAAIVATALALSTGQPASAWPGASAGRPWLDAPLGFLLHTRAEFGVDVALVLRIVGQLTADSRALEVSEIRRLGFEPAELRELAPLFPLQLRTLEPPRSPVEPTLPPPLPDLPAPERGASPGRRANAATCLGPAASCTLSPGCVEWATDPRRAGLELTHQAAWLLFVRWNDCPLAIDTDALQASVLGRLLGELAVERSYSEAHLERVATLGHLGHADRIDPEWARTILAARSPEGCWGAKPGGPCHPHPTALALWALAHAERAGRWDPNGGP